MRRPFQLISALLFLCLLGLPGLQMIFSWFEEEALTGVEGRAKEPVLTRSSLLNGDFQSAVENWFSVKLGFRGALIRKKKKKNFWMCRTMTSSYGAPFVLGFG